jgi:nitrogenase molybdenum-iron protein alpha chain
MSFNKVISIPIQERNFGTIGAYWGPAKSLLEAIINKQAPQRIRTFSQAKPDEIIYALHLLHQITDAAIVVHGANGCSSVKHFLQSYDGPGTALISTALTENDSIMGNDKKLREAIRKVYRFEQPKVIFVVTTPIVAINNEDIQSAAVELSEELETPVVPIFADGFKSKIGSNGYAIVFHALANYLIPIGHQETDKNQVNIITTTEHYDDVEYLRNLIVSLKLEPNIFPAFGNLSNFSKSVHSAFSLGLSPDSRVIGEFMENERGIPFSYLLPPIGVNATSNWIIHLATLFERQDQATLLIESQNTQIEAEFNKLSSELKGLKVYISGGSVIALSLANLAQEIGMKVVGISLSSLGQKTAEFVAENYNRNNWDFNLHIGEGQSFEQANIILRAQPDVYIGGLGEAACAAKLGIPAVCYNSMPLYGYDAAVGLAKKISLAVQNKSLVRKLGFLKPVYSKSWLDKSPTWYIKQEVK